MAQVLNVPNITSIKEAVFETVTKELRINGTGLIGAQMVDIFFKPPVYKKVAYDDITRYPLTTDEVVLRLRPNYKWRYDTGPLVIQGVDTGGGPVRLNGDDGVKIGDFIEDADQYSVSVDSTAYQQLIYHDEPLIQVDGRGFNPIGNTLRFANGLLGNGVNYTTRSTTKNSIQLRLVPGLAWHEHLESLPAPLSLVAINTGEGFVAVGPTNAGIPPVRDIAMVFERPSVYSGTTLLYRTSSRKLRLKGTGFPLIMSGYKPLLKFSPVLTVDVDYSVRVVDRTEMEFTLLPGRAWRAFAGPLQLNSINTRGDETGWVVLPGGGVTVADVVEDVVPSFPRVEVFPMGEKVYQSALNQNIRITGFGFKEGISFEFQPQLTVGIDYSLVVVSPHYVELSLKPSRKWTSTPGYLVAKSVTVDGVTQTLPFRGIRVVYVLEDPVIISASSSSSSSSDAPLIQETQTNIVAIRGSGFTRAVDMKISILPTFPNSFKILDVTADTIKLQLKPDMAWLPSYMSLSSDVDINKRIPLQVVSIDTGAGEVFFDKIPTVGYLVRDALV